MSNSQKHYEIRKNYQNAHKVCALQNLIEGIAAQLSCTLSLVVALNPFGSHTCIQAGAGQKPAISSEQLLPDWSSLPICNSNLITSHMPQLQDLQKVGSATTSRALKHPGPVAELHPEAYAEQNASHCKYSNQADDNRTQLGFLTCVGRYPIPAKGIAGCKTNSISLPHTHGGPHLPKWVSSAGGAAHGCGPRAHGSGFPACIRPHLPQTTHCGCPHLRGPDWGGCSGRP